jgi:Tfp pilus assembly protein PilP
MTIRRGALVVVGIALLVQSAAAQGTSAGDQPRGFNYDPAGRRDPFVSLARRGAEAPGTTANRSLGLAGQPAADIVLRGVLVSRNEYVAIVQGSDDRTYIVRAGQKLLDGTVRTIDKTSMVIVQQVSDPLSLEKQRELRKVLRQDEAK